MDWCNKGLANKVQRELQGIQEEQIQGAAATPRAALVHRTQGCWDAAAAELTRSHLSGVLGKAAYGRCHWRHSATKHQRWRVPGEAVGLWMQQEPAEQTHWHMEEKLFFLLQCLSSALY